MDRQRAAAAEKIQASYRRYVSRKRLGDLIRCTWEKVFDPQSGEFFYFNVNTNTSQWERPRNISQDDQILTPRSRIRFKLLQDKRAEGRVKTADKMSKSEAARVIQGLYRTRKARAYIKELIAATFEKIYDPETNAYFYHNTLTGESSWFKPILMGSDDLQVVDEQEYEDEKKQTMRQAELSAMHAFLQSYQLEHLESILHEQGFDDMEALAAMRKHDMETIGIKERYWGLLMDAITQYRREKGIFIPDDSESEQDDDHREEKQDSSSSMDEDDDSLSQPSSSSAASPQNYEDDVLYEEEEEESEEEEDEDWLDQEDDQVDEDGNLLGLKITTVFPGDGKNFARPGLFAKVHFTASLEDGTVFESSRKRGRPFDFLVGAGHVIPGWDKAIRRMSIGERARLQVEPELAYGKVGRPPLVPGDARLNFEIELIDVYDAQIGELPPEDDDFIMHAENPDD